MFGKVDMGEEKLADNLRSTFLQVANNKPSGVKGDLINKAFVTSTFGRSYPLDLEFVDPLTYLFMAEKEVKRESRNIV